ncbi:hypothetical protein MCGFDL_MCGFDL_16105, partial [Dysosmobacter welbionis]
MPPADSSASPGPGPFAAPERSGRRRPVLPRQPRRPPSPGPPPAAARPRRGFPGSWPSVLAASAPAPATLRPVPEA